MIKKIPQHVADNLDDRLVAAFSPILQSVRSWLIAKRLSINYKINPALRIGAQCMATVIASQPPPDEQALPILLRKLRINEAHILKTQTSQSPSVWSPLRRISQLSDYSDVGYLNGLISIHFTVQRYVYLIDLTFNISYIAK